jgi:hypothetical protein
LPVAGGVAGLALFGYAVREAGVAEIVDGVRRVGWGLLLILALTGLRFALRAQCWRLCMPPQTRLPLREAFVVFLAGDAAGNLLPLGLAASEPTKVLLTRGRLPTAAAVSSLAVDNLIYLTTVLVVIAAGIAMLGSGVRLPFDLQRAAVVTMALLAAAVAGAAFAARGRVRGAWKVFGIHMTFHALSVLEHYVTLAWLLGDATIAQAVIVEALNRVLTLVFKFVPFRVGVDEAASAELAVILGMAPAVGVTSAVVRKVRNLFWTGVGGALIVGRRARAVPATDRP